MTKTTSLRLRIILLFLVSELVLVGALATATFLFTSKRLTKSFDTALIANAEAIATLVREDAHEAEPLEVDFSDETMSRFSRRKHPDFFAVLLADGKVLECSRSLKSVPDWVEPEKEIELRDFRALGERYRGVLLPAHAQVDEEESSRERRGSPITVFFATSREDLDDDLEDILEFLIIAAASTVLLSTFAAFWIARRGLLPLRQLAGDATRIDAQSLDRRFVPGELPTDLQPLAHAFNDLLMRLQAAFDQERQFSADAAHELRTPVAVLKSGIQAALLAPSDPGRDRRALNELLEDALRIESLCESLLMVSRDTALDGTNVQISAQGFIQEVHDIIAALGSKASEQRASINCEELAFTTDPLPTDAEALRRILTNLIDNSLRHGGEGVRVEVVLGMDGDRPSVSVSDSGPGIPESLIPRLFSRFARGDDSRARATGGAGLGLAISRALAERSGGSLTYEPIAGCAGARFVWRLAAAHHERPFEGE